MDRRKALLLLSLIGLAPNVGAVAFAEVRITHVTKGTLLLCDPANQEITSRVDPSRSRTPETPPGSRERPNGALHVHSVCT